MHTPRIGITIEGVPYLTKPPVKTGESFTNIAPGEPDGHARRGDGADRQVTTLEQQEVDVR